MSEFVKEFNSAELREVIAGGGKVLVDFFATWCGPCKMLAPVVDKVASKNENVTFVKVDIDKNVLLIKGSVPGNKGAILKIRDSVKSAK